MHSFAIQGQSSVCDVSPMPLSPMPIYICKSNAWGYSFIAQQWRIATVAKGKVQSDQWETESQSPPPLLGRHRAELYADIYWQLPKTPRIEFWLEMAERELPRLQPPIEDNWPARICMHFKFIDVSTTVCWFLIYFWFFTHSQDLCLLWERLFLPFRCSGSCQFFFCDWAIALRFPEVQLLRTFRLTDFTIKVSSIILMGFLHLCNVALLLFLFACQAYSAE